MIELSQIFGIQAQMGNGGHRSADRCRLHHGSGDVGRFIQPEAEGYLRHSHAAVARILSNARPAILKGACACASRRINSTTTYV